jgi:hypothetical protein
MESIGGDLNQITGHSLARFIEALRKAGAVAAILRARFSHPAARGSFRVCGGR